MNSKSFHHALTVREDLCRGCTRCMRNCPTEAIRLSHGKAHVNPDRCVDCGQCMDACPYGAIVVEQDDFEKIFSYNQRIAILPSVFIGQFADDIPENYIYTALRDIGFTDIYEAEFGVDILKTIGNRFSTYADDKPVISTYCPAIVRLIQIKYPSLVKHLNLLRPPVEITAMYIRNKLIDRQIPPEDIGIFYVTPCAAKIASIKSPENPDHHEIFTGVINMDYLYNLVQKSIAKNKKLLAKTARFTPIPPLTPEACMWSLTAGESSTVPGRTLAIDEIHNVIEFLERLENDEITNIDFLELRSCAEGCAGGVLAPGNRFLAKERLTHRSQHMREITPEQQTMIRRQASYLVKHIKKERIEAKSAYQLDDDIGAALKKMDRYLEIKKALPGIDCGLCGAPSCHALAEDIAKGHATVSQCVVLRLRSITQRDDIHKVWGDTLDR
ncbi:MAG: 4Fe-4S binding protein [Spirochaetia bacterium]|nr:4Fe-4S binding protein [Spirochaetia bacterium]MCF7941072.1 4Fe-4S binding protein [Spirochaetia bacterium]